MKFFINKKSDWWPIVTLAFLMAGLWGSIFFNGLPASEQGIPGEENNTAYEEVLPNFLAPVIRKDVRQESESEEKPVVVNITIPRLDFLFTIWK